MDNSLLQLERELFSLSPAEPKRQLCSHLERTVCAPVQIQRRVPPPSGPFPFQWKRVVIPAAAAVAVVAVMSSTENSPSAAVTQHAGLTANLSGGNIYKASAMNPAKIQKANPSNLKRETGNSRFLAYPLVSSQGLMQQLNWDAVDRHFWVNPETNSSIQLSVPRRESTMVPVRFH